MDDIEKRARKATKAILYDLEDRKGVGNELEGVKDEFPDTYREIKRTIARIIVEHMRGATE